MDPVIHSNKRFRESPDVGVHASLAYAAGATHSFPSNGLTNHRTGSSDQSSNSDPANGSISRSVSDSSLALPGPDSRTGGGNLMPQYMPAYSAAELQNQHLMIQPHGAMQTSANAIPFQENPSSTNRGPSPSHMGTPYLLPSAQMQPMNGCIPQSLPMTNGQMASVQLPNSMAGVPMGNAGLAHMSASSNFITAPNNVNGMMPGTNGMVQSQSYQQNMSSASAVPASSASTQAAAATPPLPNVAKWESSSNPGVNTSGTTTPTVQLEPPCAACKSLRRKCTRDCIFLPYFPRDDPEKFARVHKVFGASNVAKMLQDLPMHQREDTVASLEYEAQARVQDPVFGCVGILCLLQKQIAMLQSQVTELQRHQGIAPRQDGLNVQSGMANGLNVQSGMVNSSQVNHLPTMPGGTVMPHS